jgi:nucleoside-diphosphate-sugar epimerase
VKTILLTGATGFLGSHLLEVLLKANYRVVILKRSTSNCWRINNLLAHVKSYDIDINSLETAFLEQKIDIVIHTACHYGRNEDELTEIVGSNLMFGLEVLVASIKHKAQLFLNTDTLLNKNLNCYTLSKKQFVEWLQQASNEIKVINLKLEHMYGPKDDSAKFVPWVIEQLKLNKQELKLTLGEQQRDFVYIDDIISAYMIMLEKYAELPDFTEFDVVTGNPISIKEFLKTLKRIYGDKKSRVQTRLNFGAIPYRNGEAMSIRADNTPIKNLGWQAKTTIEQGLINTIESYK